MYEQGNPFHIMPSVRLLEAGETNVGNGILLGGKKAFEGLREAVSKHLDSRSRNMSTVPLESIFKLILAQKRAIVLILCFHHLKHAVIDHARLNQTLHEQAV